jgi:lysyl-tRNA synthetase class 2
MKERPPPPLTATRWWLPFVHMERRERLRARAAIVAALRGWFAGQNFLEVESSALVVSPGNEAHLHAFRTQMIGLDGVGHDLYLHTSPEFGLKKLLAAGEPRLVDFARVFRNRERSATHHPSFTLLEWYRAGEPYEQLMADCVEILRIAARTSGVRRLAHRGRLCDPFAPPRRVTVAEAFRDHAGIDLMATLPAAGSGREPDRDMLAYEVAARGLRVADDDTWSDLFSHIMVALVEPHLGDGQPLILCEYPVQEAALARPAPHDPRVAERFELYACGIELANAFGELTDPIEQRRRFGLEMDEKERVYGERYPIDEDFLSALGLMPQASGCALGLDRLVMLATDARHIDEVIWTPLPDL